MPLLRNGALEESPWVHHIAGEPVEANQLVSLSDYLQQPDAWHHLEGPWAAVAQPEDDLSTLPAELLARPQFAIAFPVYTDGRGYSHAKLLRHVHGYKGELIATGDVRRDQIDFMARVGIDSFECNNDINLAHWLKALTELHVEQEA